MTLILSIKEKLRRLLKYTSVQLSLSLLISVILIVSILSLFSYRQSAVLIEKETAESSRQIIERTSLHLDYLLNEYKDFSDMMRFDQALMNKLIVLSNSDEEELKEMAALELKKILSSYTYANRFAQSITIFSNDQSYVISTYPDKLINPIIANHNAENIRNTDWFSSMNLTHNDMFVLDARKEAFVSTHTNEPYFAVARSIPNPLNPLHPLGTILMEVSTKDLEAVFSQMKFGQSGGYVIISEQGTIIYSSDPELEIGTQYKGVYPEEAQGQGKTVKQGAFDAEDARGVQQHYVFQRVDRAGWYVVGYYPKAELLQPMQNLLWNSIELAAVCSLVAALCVGFLVQRGVGRPLRNLYKVLKEGESGNLSVRTRMNPDSEIGDLGITFNRMMEKISLAYYDSVTNLPNRRYLIDKIAEEVEKSKANNELLAAIFIDLDRFKAVNDTLGHQAGDLLIQLVAERLNRCVREGDTVARIAGDEFVVLLPSLKGKEAAVKTAWRIVRELRESFTILSQNVHITASAGIAYCPVDASDAEGLIRTADIAMYHAKSNGKNNIVVFHQDLVENIQKRMMIENDMHHAVLKNEFELYYQPRVDSSTGRIVCTEALLRWNHPKLGWLLPDKFIHIAEDTGIIVPLGKHVVEKACKQNREWRRSGFPPMRIAVNVSAKQLNEDFACYVASVLEDTETEPKWLEIEITEGVLLEDGTEAMETLRRMKEMGLHLSIDDFGTGYSNLAFLKKYAVATLKIDKSFIRDVHRNMENQAIAGTIIKMAKSLGMNVASEGVETFEEFSYICKEGSDEIQGYFISEPVDAAAYEILLQNKRTSIASDME